MRLRLPLLLAVFARSLVVFGQTTSHLEVQWPSGERNPATAIVALDADDDNDDRVPDLEERPAPDPARDNEIVNVVVTGVGAGAVRVHAEGGVRVVSSAGLASDGLIPANSAGHAVVPLIGIEASRTGSDASVSFTAAGGSQRVAITVVGASILGGDDTVRWGHRDALRVSHEITNNDTLPRGAGWTETSRDPWNLRAEIWDPGTSLAGLARIESVAAAVSSSAALGTVRGAINNIVLDRPSADLPLRSRFVRLVGDDTDLRAPGVQGQTLLVALRDTVRLRYRRPGVAGEATTDLRVGRPGDENGPLAARSARWHLIVMRDRAGGRPMIGGDDASAVRIAREQVTVSDEIYLQCMMTFGDPATYPVAIADPPQGSLLAVSDDDGIRAAGGEIQLRVNGRGIAPVHALAGWRAIDTADAIGAAIRAAGFVPRITMNRRTDYGADGSADIVVHDARGRLAEITPALAAPLTTDPQQSIALGRVDFADGLDEFNNLNSSAGTLEERTLLKSLADDDLTTIELFVINRFTHQSRIGEAFVEGDGGAVVNALIIDRAGIAAQREAWTQSHEAGHIFLNQPWHPDNMGPDRPWLLMDADASLGAVTGPKRLEPNECARLTAESGVSAVPPLLSRFDPMPASARAPEFASWPPRELYPRTPAVSAPSPAPASSAPVERDRPAAAVGLRFD